MSQLPNETQKFLYEFYDAVLSASRDELKALMPGNLREMIENTWQDVPDVASRDAMRQSLETEVLKIMFGDSIMSVSVAVLSSVLDGVSDKSFWTSETIRELAVKDSLYEQSRDYCTESAEIILKHVIKLSFEGEIFKTPRRVTKNEQNLVIVKKDDGLLVTKV